MTKELFKGNAIRWIKNNSSKVLTIIGAAGFVITVVTAIKATPKAMELIDEAKEQKGEELTKVEVVKVTAKTFIPTVILGVSSLTCIFSASILDHKKQAAITGAYALLENSYKQYKGKVQEILGPDVDAQIRSSIAEDKYNETPFERKDPDKILFYDDATGQYFEAYEKDVLEAEYMINREIATTGCATIEYWLDLLDWDFKKEEAYKYIGWNYESAMDWSDVCWVDFEHKKVTMDDGLEATVIYAYVDPSLDYMDDWVDIPPEISAQYNHDYTQN